MKKELTAGERREYTIDLRNRWKLAKQASENMTDAQALQLEEVRAIIPTMSATGFLFILIQMTRLWLSGLPGLDALTFNWWKARGYAVKKGEKSKLHGVTWIVSGEKDGEDGDDKIMYPKSYHLFHSSQVEEVKNLEEKE